MIATGKKYIRTILGPIYDSMSGVYRKKLRKKRQNKEYDGFIQALEISKGKKKMIHMGTTEHVNLGDLAQCYCIGKWIDTYCSDYVHLQISATAIVEQQKRFFALMDKSVLDEDIFVFQSGYTTTDLDWVHDTMHRVVAEHYPKAKILMMPQTILFVHDKNKQRTSRILDAAVNLVFLARDQKSFVTAKDMFPHLNIKLYPDIVTSLIGSFRFTNKRDGVFLCRRNDGEKFYSEEELNALRFRLESITNVKVGDTQSLLTFDEVMSNLKGHIESEIAKYSYFKVTITDRYHGTIFSLCAGTPVIIIKTTDHKVVAGADWFKGVYDDYVYVAKDLEEAYKLAVEIIGRSENSKTLSPYFEETYYGKALRTLVNDNW